MIVFPIIINTFLDGCDFSPNSGHFVTHLFTTDVLAIFPHGRAGSLRPEEDWWLHTDCPQRLRHQRVELFEGMRRIRRCGPVGRSVSPGEGFEVSDVHTRLRHSLPDSPPPSPNWRIRV